MEFIITSTFMKINNENCMIFSPSHKQIIQKTLFLNSSYILKIGNYIEDTIFKLQILIQKLGYEMGSVRHLTLH